eukprot:TRINITY_DN20902_c0_g1_i1.p1 TRINITY_DN20902_c0_g1~~TRINITY_DN20902_c0_g1_i1.p1  ORF type:complete len:369 (+),score=119.62 TRINITY_DN20902_c0_g1_i1:787-1893(+)
MPEALKNAVNSKFVNELAKSMRGSWNQFPKSAFIQKVLDAEWEDRELKSRLIHVAETMRELLPQDFKEAVRILKPVSAKYTGMTGLLFPEFIGRHQNRKEDWDIAMDGLEAFTKNASAEFAVRPYIVEDQDKMMKQMLKWSLHNDYNVRRLATEGCRPRLPWATGLPGLQKDASPIIPILMNLKNDSAETVRRSVANNLNDISKDHPDLVLRLAKEWKGESAEVDWVVKHGCRTLLKAGNADAMGLFGFADGASIKVTKLTMHPKKIEIGAAGEVSFHLTLPPSMTDVGSDDEAPVRIEYGVYYRKKNGSLSRKVFKLSERRVGKSGKVTKKHSFKDLSTRVHHPGEHKVSIIVNGVEKAETKFKLIE